MKCKRCDAVGRVHYEAMGEQCSSWCQCPLGRSKKKMDEFYRDEIRSIEMKRAKLFTPEG